LAGKETHVTRHCFACGTENAAGLGLAPRTDGEWIRATFTPRAHHRGMSNVVHGGIVAAALDEVLGCAISVRERSLGATVGLEVEFLAPLLVTGTYEVRARATGKAERIHTAEGEIVDASGRVLARGRGRFVTLTPDRFKEFVGPTPSDPSEK